jgi:hypothetical protein
MTYDELVTMLEEANLPLAYDHFAEGESPEPPFLIFLSPSSEIFGADNISYAAFPEINVELYTNKKDPELEQRIENIFTRHGIYYLKSETWIESERFFEVLYQITP